MNLAWEGYPGIKHGNNQKGLKIIIHKQKIVSLNVHKFLA